MTEGSSSTWRRRCLAVGLAAAVTVAGVGAAVAGQGEPPEREDALVAAARPDDLANGGSAPLPPETTVPTVSGDEDAPTTPTVTQGDERQALEVSRSLPAPASAPAGLEEASSSPVTPPTPYTTVDVSRIFGERVGSGSDDPVDGEGLAAGLEAEVRACVATLLDGIEASVEGHPDAERIQAVASEVVDDVLACVAGLVDMSQVLSCVSGVIQEILDVVIAMDFADLPQLINEFADDMVRCVAV